MGILKSVAETTGLKTKDVKGALVAMMDVAAKELKKTGSFKFAGRLNLKLKKKGCNSSSQGCESFHERALRLQGQACIENCESLCNDEAQGGNQLNAAAEALN